MWQKQEILMEYFRDFLLSSGLKNHREHRVHREKLFRSVLSVYSVVEKICSNSLFQEKLKRLIFHRKISFFMILSGMTVHEGLIRD
jgi:hypothetical protein